MKSIKTNKNIIKRFLAFAVIVAMLFATMPLAGCTRWESYYEWGEDSFLLEVTTERIGETIGVIVTAKLTNTSGRNLNIIISRVDNRRPLDIEQIISIPPPPITVLTPRTKNAQFASGETITVTRNLFYVPIGIDIQIFVSFHIGQTPPDSGMIPESAQRVNIEKYITIY